MKTTIEIPDSLRKQVKSLASRERTTVRALAEEGLRRVMAERKGAKPFRLRMVPFAGDGLQPRVAGAP